MNRRVGSLHAPRCTCINRDITDQYRIEIHLSQTWITFYRIQFTTVLLMVTRGVYRQVCQTWLKTSSEIASASTVHSCIGIVRLTSWNSNNFFNRFPEWTGLMMTIWIRGWLQVPPWTHICHFGSHFILIKVYVSFWMMWLE
jgi:hypothetical protein